MGAGGLSGDTPHGRNLGPFPPVLIKRGPSHGPTLWGRDCNKPVRAHFCFPV